MVVESVEPCCLLTKFFYVTRARKDDKYRQNTFFLLERGELGTQQTTTT